jgi:hypothetical protein
MQSPAGIALAVAGFALWAVFALLPALAEGGRVREAWDTELYWIAGVPLMLLALIAAGWRSQDAPWKLALWPIAGHALGMVLIQKAGTDLGLLPIAILFIGIPAFAVFTGAAAIGRGVRRWTT